MYTLQAPESTKVEIKRMRTFALNYTFLCVNCLLFVFFLKAAVCLLKNVKKNSTHSTVRGITLRNQVIVTLLDLCHVLVSTKQSVLKWAGETYCPGIASGGRWWYYWFYRKSDWLGASQSIQSRLSTLFECSALLFASVLDEKREISIKSKWRRLWILHLTRYSKTSILVVFYIYSFLWNSSSWINARKLYHFS